MSLLIYFLHLNYSIIKIYTVNLKCKDVFPMIEVTLEQTHFIVTFHYHGVVLSLIPAVQPGGSRTAGLFNRGREEARRL